MPISRRFFTVTVMVVFITQMAATSMMKSSRNHIIVRWFSTDSSMTPCSCIQVRQPQVSGTMPGTIDHLHDRLGVVGILQLQFDAADVAFEIEELLRDVQRHVAAFSGRVGPQGGDEREVLRQHGDVVERLGAFGLLRILRNLPHLPDELVHAVSGVHDERVADFGAESRLANLSLRTMESPLRSNLPSLRCLVSFLQQCVVRFIRHADDADALQIARVFDDDDAFGHRHGGDDLGTRREGFAQLAPVW
jgi:hypothetical protein